LKAEIVGEEYTIADVALALIAYFAAPHAEGT
jgi:glutathione S-transferase